MKRLCKLILPLLIAVVLPHGVSAAQGVDSALVAKAHLAMEQHQWANAQALYLLLEDKNPDYAEAYTGHIVASEMRGQSDFAVETLERAISAGVAPDSILNPFRSAVRALGQPHLYPQLLQQAAQKLPYMSRVFDARLLDYYSFRRNSTATIEYARKLLAGLPTDTRFLLTLAQAEMDAGNMGAATDAWERVLAADPSNFDALVALGNYLVLNKEGSKARPYLQRAYSIKPTPYVARLLKQIPEV
ncbi:MAG: tetratricopeptide repeat protein [Bacteroidales bacterium]|nr:tetratricopeptide repeat protein [Bacteroidales bacterium]